jgi:hypothetical protein
MVMKVFTDADEAAQTSLCSRWSRLKDLVDSEPAVADARFGYSVSNVLYLGTPTPHLFGMNSEFILTKAFEYFF